MWNLWGHPTCLFLILLLGICQSYPTPCTSPKRKRLPRLKSGSYFPMFSSKSFSLSVLTFKSLIHFKLAILRGGKTVSSFYMYISNFPSTVMKRLPFLHWIFLAPCQILADHICMGLFWALALCFIIMFCFSSFPYTCCEKFLWVLTSTCTSECYPGWAGKPALWLKKKKK